MHSEHFTHDRRRAFLEARLHHDGRDFRGAPDFGAFGPGRWGGAGGGWGGPGGRRRPKGDVRAALLSLLAENGPTNGYGLMKAIAEKTEGSWRPSPGSVYPTLQQLVDEELISSRGEGRGTEFELTEAGRAYVSEHEEELSDAWTSVPRPSESTTELFQSAGRLMSVIGQFRHGATDAQRAAAAEKLDEARRALYLILAD
ncbi:PadR family transcriptional regulator [Rathayibacter sp. YIM 133350]|uniref:PadR family transcriptional regulator n=1 Tax=Rathayibacter sp. YIM 133350 TaxID=3131992 RepID=UPI00307D7A6A